MAQANASYDCPGAICGARNRALLYSLIQFQIQTWRPRDKSIRDLNAIVLGTLFRLRDGTSFNRRLQFVGKFRRGLMAPRWIFGQRFQDDFIDGLAAGPWHSF